MPTVQSAYTPIVSTLDFELPPDLEAAEPPEARGLARDHVRLMVSHYGDDAIAHARFYQLADYLEAGDVLVINTSATLPAALPAHRRAAGMPVNLHLSTQLAADLWVVELRRGSDPFLQAQPGEIVDLPAGGTAVLLAPYRPAFHHQAAGTRLWVARLALPQATHAYLEAHGSPIHYRYVTKSWPLAYYQTAYASEPGSAEMPSAGRAFTPQLITRLVAKGVQFAPLVLHTGVASLEANEPPYGERFRVTTFTANLVNAAHAEGRRIIAVGTTAVRALETAAGADGLVRAASGWTELVITPRRGLRIVNGLLTGLHEPRASHLAMLEAFTGRRHLELTYAAALRCRYLWHEFGDLHLILP
ncbi:MAG: S-adenosylmethionine:tRNA ribosyltransferase-isomerase [Ardenticatenaceae bacterium]|nr:S-adenosylmethionine:tRNA ribosyltransferase-isomerase [Ardenticatenaceae bacterium]